MFIPRVRQLLYLLRQGGQNLRSGGASAGIAIISISCALLLVCLYFMTLSNLSEALDSVKNTKVVLYLRESLSASQVSRLRQELEAYTEISRVRYVSKGMALKEFRKALGRQATLLEGLETNPLPASFELSFPSDLDKPDQIKRLLQGLASRPEVESIQGGVEWVQRLSTLLAAVRLVLFFLGTILAIISLFIISSTIHLTIDRRRDEIMVMRLVGASEWYIRLPFLFEGILEGLLGGCLAILISAVVYSVFRWKMSPLLTLVLGTDRITFLDPEKMVVTLVLGFVLGGLGAMISFLYHPA